LHPTFEEPQIALDIIWLKGNPIDDDIELLTSQSVAHLKGVLISAVSC